MLEPRRVGATLVAPVVFGGFKNFKSFLGESKIRLRFLLGQKMG